MPIDIIDQSDLEDLYPSARVDFIKATTRFRDGDLEAAISSAYAAVENVIKSVYENNENLGEIDYSKSFQDRCKKTIETTGIYKAIDQQLSYFNWEENEANELRKNLEGSVNQSVYVLQLLRNKMSDAHGSKPVIKPLAFDILKWAKIIIRLLSQKYNG